MHELALTQSLVEIAATAARNHGASRVHSVTLEVGALAGVVPDAIEFCFEACTKETLLEGCRLIIVAIPGKGSCVDCGAEVALDPYTVACSACGGFSLDRLQGEELRVTELEMD